MVYWLNSPKKQDLRIDLPTIGLKTLKQCKLAGLKGIVVKNKQNIFLDKKKCINFKIRIKCLFYQNEKDIFIIINFFYFFTYLHSSEIKLEKIFDGLSKPWSLSFVDENNILVTEKSGNLLFVNLKDKTKSIIKHNLSVLEDGQGGLLDVLFHNGNVYVSYSENRGNWHSSTSVARGILNKKNTVFKNIFRAEPPINSGYHFGSRLVIKKDKLYITAGERGEGMIAQDPQKHPGSIIRINLDGSIPKDNPKFKK